MCPARAIQLHPKQFKDQRELKHKRSMVTLRRYAKRRKQFAQMKLLVVCVYFSYYLPVLRLWRAQQRRIAARPADKKRQRKHRKLAKIRDRIARIEAKRTVLAEQIAKLKERVQIKEFHLRMKATAQSGWTDGWNSAQAGIAKQDAELKALSYSRRYRDAYSEAVAEHTRLTAKMAAQQAKSFVQPKPIFM